MSFNRHSFAAAALLATCLISGCAYETGVQRYSESRSKFNTPPVLNSHTLPDKDIYRLFQQGATGFVPISSIRENLEDRAEKYCTRQGKGMLLLGEASSKPPYILGNFPRVEIVFATVEKK